jgi:hypothetical protein
MPRGSSHTHNSRATFVSFSSSGGGSHFFWFLMSQDFFFSYIQVHLSAVNDVRPIQKEEDTGQSVGRS